MMADLTERQLIHLQELLDTQEISARIRARVAIPEESDDCAPTDVDDAMIKMELVELADIEAAHRRIDNHQYGLCIDCGCTIDYARLQASPTAKRCTQCQRLHEQRHH